MKTLGPSLFALVTSVVVACGGPAVKDGSVDCKGEARRQLDCSREVKYDGINTGGSVGIANLGAKASYEDVAIRRINENVEKYVATQSRLCNEYNNCTIDQEGYNAQAKELRNTLMSIGPAAAKLGSTESEADRKKILSDVYQTAVPASSRPEDVEFRFSMEAELPPELQSVRAGSFVVRPNEPLPTGAKVSFSFEVSKSANLYVFQSSPATGAGALYPDARIGTTNPLASGAKRRIPDGNQTFRLNDKDIGTEWVYVAVSTKPITSLQAAMKRVSSGQVSKLENDADLGKFTKLAMGGPKMADCRRLELVDSAPATSCAVTRGVIIEGTSAEAPPKSSLAVRTDPGDDTIVKAFPFVHVAPQDYAAAQKTFAATLKAGGRGILLE